MDIFNSNSIEENFPINVCRCCLAEGCYKDISSEYFISGKKEVYEEMLKDVFNVEISYQKYGGPSRYSRLICENCIIKLRDAREFKYKVLASEKSFIKYLDNMQINIKQEENIQETDIISEERAIKVELDVNTDNEVESSENDIFGNSQVVNYYDVLGIKVETEFNIDNEIESHQTLEEQIEENHTDVMGVKLESQLNDDNEIESHETLTDQTDGNHIEIFGNLKLQLNKEFNNISTGGENVCDKRKSTTESNTKSKKPKPADEGTNCIHSNDGCELDSEKSKPVLPANVICDIPINILNETEDSISFVIPKGALTPSDSISDKGDLSKGKDGSPFVPSSNMFKKSDILDGSNNIGLSLENLKHPLSEDIHDTNILEGKDKSPKGIVLAEDTNEKTGSNEKLETNQSNSMEKSTLSKKETVKRSASKYCVFCQNFVLSYYKHMLSKHSAEPEVKRVLETPVGSLERRNIFTALRERGKCLGFYSTTQLPNNFIKCDFTLLTKNARVKKQNSRLRHVKLDCYLKNKVFPLMEPNAISKIAQKDKMICMFGSHYFRKYGETYSVTTSHKMRDLAILLIEVNKLKPEISCLEQVLKPQYYTTLVDASKNFLQYSNDEKQFDALVYILNIAKSLKQCCRIANFECSKLEDTPDSAKFKEDLKALLILINRNWRRDIATLIHRNDNIDHHEKSFRDCPSKNVEADKYKSKSLDEVTMNYQVKVDHKNEKIIANNLEKSDNVSNTSRGSFNTTRKKRKKCILWIDEGNNDAEYNF
ncbi:unnamed protein product [Parnassius mnemosyne]|uniref:ZAD domain-containing protein n=1 Tax=Parnassius mnemosyne TaxID=213953 RepID=A0AAV1L0G8_9NEOP